MNRIEIQSQPSPEFSVPVDVVQQAEENGGVAEFSAITYAPEPSRMDEALYRFSDEAATTLRSSPPPEKVTPLRNKVLTIAAVVGAIAAYGLAGASDSQEAERSATPNVPTQNDNR